MKKFGCGMGFMLALLGIAVVVWFSLDEQAKGIVIGIGLGLVGAIIGGAFALALVAIFLLAQMRWQVQGRPQAPPIVMGYPPPAGYLDSPVDAEFSVHPPPADPHWKRPGRGFQVIGGDDAPPGTRPSKPRW